MANLRVFLKTLNSYPESSRTPVSRQPKSPIECLTTYLSIPDAIAIALCKICYIMYSNRCNS
ncbi:MAG TPA: hypothetical protein V6C85_07430 [Allocoleopsis sp.]